MITYYTVIGFGPEGAVAELSSSDYVYTDKKFRTFKAKGQARVFRDTMNRKSDGNAYKILRTDVWNDGVTTVSYVQ